MTRQQFLKLCSLQTDSDSCYTAIFDRDEKEATEFISFLWDKEMKVTNGALHAMSEGKDFAIAYSMDADGNSYKTFFVTCPTELTGTVLAFNMQATDVHGERNLFCALGDDGVLTCSAIVKDDKYYCVEGINFHQPRNLSELRKTYLSKELDWK